MANIAPFAGIKYNRAKAGDFNAIITQPYDKITPEMQNRYYQASPFNYVRLILGREADRYHEAEKNFSDWMTSGVLVKDPAPALYPYHQEFVIKGAKKTRKGFVAVVELEEFEKGGILPHERTLSKPKADRLTLMRQTKKNLEQVFMLYFDPADRIAKLFEPTSAQPPEIAVTDEYQTNHRLWTVSEPETIRQVKELMKNKVLFIADGHHRYETSLNYRNEQRQSNPGFTGKEAFNYRMVTLVNLADPGLLILPTHRLIYNLPGFDFDQFLNRTEEFFTVKKTGEAEIGQALNKGSNQHTFGAFSKQSGGYLLTLKDRSLVDRFVPKERSPDYKQLDVTILHSVIIENLLGIRPENIEDHVRYERELEDAVRKVKTGEFQLAFLINPTRPEQVEKVAQNRERMPQKSTDFFPKLVSGLVAFNIAQGEVIDA
jgi:uncharacterized protein (DUF1015 family)